MSSLFEKKTFTSHSGLPLTWKMECDALTEEDWSCLAFLISEQFKFYKVIGIPRGGLALARHLEKYTDPQADYLLLVDDVLTTGGSMTDMLLHNQEVKDAKEKVIGVVVFDRRDDTMLRQKGIGPPNWVFSMFKFWEF